MAAHENINPHQLQMFMRPHEILNMVKGSVEISDQSRLPEHLAYKVREAKKPGHMMGRSGPPLYDQIKEHGVQAPVILTTDNPDDPDLNPKTGRSDHFWIGNGHHRLASAQAIEKETGEQKYIPVIHDDDFMGSYESMTAFPGMPRN